MKPTAFLLASAAIDASVCACTRVPRPAHVFIVAPGASRQSTGSRVWLGESPTTITVIENRFNEELIAATGPTARNGSRVPARLPMTSVTSGRRPSARRFAQRDHLPHSSVPPHERGTHRTFTSGTTAQLSRRAIAKIVGIHIWACESPITTIVFAVAATPRRQTLLRVACPDGVHPSGKA